jgi:ribosomal protein S12 methylthiotransferase accessory factor
MATYRELFRDYETLDAQPLPLVCGIEYEPGVPVLWTQGLDLLSKRPIWVPFEVVTSVPIARAMPNPVGAVGFGDSQNDATLAGLFGTVARSTADSWEKRRSEQDWRNARMDLSRGVLEPAARAVGAFDAAGIAVAAWELENPFGLPVIYVRESGSPRRVAACHLKKDTALAHALLGLSCNRAISAAGIGDDPEQVFMDVAFDPGLASIDGSIHWDEGLSPALAHVTERVKYVIALVLDHPQVAASVVRVFFPGRSDELAAT